jgi:hypothetical protein
MATYKESSFSTAKTIVPSDSVLQAYSAIYVGGAGNLAIMDQAGNQTILIAPPVGFILELAVSRVLATGTTCTNLVGFGFVPNP